MIKIAVCDDDKEFIDSFINLLRYNFSKHNMESEIKIKEFFDGRQLLAVKDTFDFVFLDMDMPEMSGREVAEILCKTEKPNIIFVTNYDSLVYQSIRYQPIRFLRKTMLEGELEDAVKAIITTHNSEMETITFKNEMGEVVKRLNDILYLEVMNHEVVAHTVEDEVRVYGTLNEYENRLKKNDFIRIQRSYLVNCRYIYAVNRKEVVLDNQKTLPISRYQIEKVKDAFYDYMRRMK